MATFATSLACMDGRVQEPLRAWITERFGVEFVDTVTQPGMDAVLAGRGPGGADGPDIEIVRRMLGISVEKHHSNAVVVSGHYDCAGNPVDDETHKEHIREAVAAVRRWAPDAEAVGVWVGSDWKVTPL